jgi:solute:Na+ symporter, SSS family
VQIFPEALPWQGGKKKFWDEIYIYNTLEPDQGWRVHDQKLSRPIAYGVSVALPGGLLCIGGCDEKASFSDVFLLRYVNGNIETEEWPPLPVPLAYSSGALVDGKVYVAGGEDLALPGASHHFFMLDTRNRQSGWQSASFMAGTCPFICRVCRLRAMAFDNCFYLFSGRNYGPGIALEILRDGYCYNPRLNTWKRLDAEPGPSFPVMAGTAVASGTGHIFLFGGSDGLLMEKENSLRRAIENARYNSGNDNNNFKVNALEDSLVVFLEQHPGFSRDIRAYHTVTNTLYSHTQSVIPFPVTTHAFRHNDCIIITSGETRPGVRTPGILSVTPGKKEKTLGTLNILVIIFYFGILAFMGWYFSRRQKTANDYFRGGGRLPWWAVGLSIFGTGLSAITFMAIPAKAFATDWSYILLNVGIILVAPVIILLFIPFFRKLNVTTAYEYLEHRFNLATRLVCSLAFILFQIGRMGIVLFLPSIALHVATGIDIFLCIGLMGVFSLIYTMMGGIEAVIWTDALQVVILLGGAILAIFYIVADVEGGLSFIVKSAYAEGKFDLADPSFNLKNPTLWTVLIASVFTNITTYGADQTMVQRYVTTKDERATRQSIWTNAVLAIPASLIFFFVGTALYVFYKQNPGLLSTSVTDGDAIFPEFIFNQMPAGISGLLISGIFAAAMSTLSSSMNSAATAWTVDIHFRFGWSDNSGQLRVGRWATMITGLLGILFAVMMATWDIKSLWDEFNKILGLVMGSLGGLFLLGIVTRRANGVGALAGMLFSIIVQLIIIRTQQVHLLLYATTGFLSCFITGYLVSLIFPDKKDIAHLTIYNQSF